MCKKSTEKAVRKIIRDQDDFRKDKAVFEDDGVTYIWNGYQIMRTVEEIPKSFFTEKSGEAKETFLKRFSEMFEEAETSGEFKRYPLPTEKELRSKIKDVAGRKTSARVVYNVSENIRMNAWYLLNAITVTDAECCYAAGRTNPILFYGDDTQYLCLPVNNKGNLKPGDVYIV